MEREEATRATFSQIHLSSIASYLPEKVARTPSPCPPQRGESPPKRPSSVHLWRAPAACPCSLCPAVNFPLRNLSLFSDRKGAEEEGEQKKKGLYFGPLPAAGHYMLEVGQTPPQSSSSRSFCPLCALPSLAFSAVGHPPPSASHHVISLSPPHSTFPSLARSHVSFSSLHGSKLLSLSVSLAKHVGTDACL